MAAYRDATAFDHPTVLVTSDGACWTAYLSGIPSTRVDAVGTVVRDTLVVDGPCGAAMPRASPRRRRLARRRRRGARRPARRLAGRGAGRPVPPGRRTALAGPGSDRRRALSSDFPCAAADEVRRRALAALTSLPSPPTAADEPGDWVGAAGAPAPRAAFTARVAALVDGAPGGPSSSTSSVRRPTRSRCSTPPPRRRAPGGHGPSARAVHRASCGGGGKSARRRAPDAADRDRGRRGTGGAAAAVIGMLAMTVLVVTLLVWLL